MGPVIFETELLSIIMISSFNGHSSCHQESSVSQQIIITKNLYDVVTCVVEWLYHKNN